MTTVRQEIARVVAAIDPADALEARHQGVVIDWIASGAELYRLVSPDQPPMRLVSYFVPFDAAAGCLLLTAHRKSGLTLPPGGHREAGESPFVHSFGDEDRVLLGVGPSGDRLLTVTHDQDLLAVHPVADGSVVAEPNADVLPPHPAFEEEATDDEVQAFFDYEGGFVDENTLVVGTVESDEEFGTCRHWLVDAVRMQLIDEITYPFEVTGPPKALGDGTWYTVSNP